LITTCGPNGIAKVESAHIQATIRLGIEVFG